MGGNKAQVLRMAKHLGELTTEILKDLRRDAVEEWLDTSWWMLARRARLGFAARHAHREIRDRERRGAMALLSAADDLAARDDARGLT